MSYISSCFLFVLAKVKSYPELDEEIDVLSAIISEQRTESRLPGNQNNPSSAATRASLYQFRLRDCSLPLCHSSAHPGFL